MVLLWVRLRGVRTLCVGALCFVSFICSRAASQRCTKTERLPLSNRSLLTEVQFFDSANRNILS
jgi:hypothetical protein